MKKLIFLCCLIILLSVFTTSMTENKAFGEDEILPWSIKA